MLIPRLYGSVYSQWQHVPEACFSGTTLDSKKVGWRHGRGEHEGTTRPVGATLGSRKKAAVSGAVEGRVSRGLF